MLRHDNKPHHGILWLLLLVVVMGLTGGRTMAEEQGPVRAPEFPTGMHWFNTAKPLRLADLRGKVVLLDFWTYCCINCMHVIPDLTALEQKYPNELVVIGVHSAKFTNEREADHIRQAILRYDIRHPVVNDREFRIWSAYTVRAWPTLMVVKPDGYLLGYLAGEGHRETLEKLIEKLIAEARAAGTLHETPLAFALERAQSPTQALSFPGKVYADEASQRLFIADSNHHRIVVTDLNGTVLEVAGTGNQGKDDGTFATATFHHPQGMALQGQVLYVADTGNHLIRRLDLEARTVTTVAGTGEQSRQFNVAGVGTQVALNSPWDVVLLNKTLFIAMAGFHQVWAMDLTSAALAPYSGSGREDIVDGPRLQAAMAQPGGLTHDGAQLYVADSETSAIRSIAGGEQGGVQTIVGEGLFEYGDQDGTKKSAIRLQHPLGLVYHENLLYVADTYNHKVKKIDVQSGKTVTFLGTGKVGLVDGSTAAFYEPGGISVASGKLYIADTNNHAIRVADLATGVVTTLALKGLAIPTAVAGFRDTHFADTEPLQVPAQTVQAGASGHLVIDVQLPQGYHLNPRAPLSYKTTVLGSGIVIEEPHRRVQAMAPSLPVRIPFQAAVAGQHATVDLDMTFYYCREDDTGVCVIQSVRWLVPLYAVAQEATRTPVVLYKAEAPQLEKSF